MPELAVIFPAALALLMLALAIVPGLAGARSPAVVRGLLLVIAGFGVVGLGFGVTSTWLPWSLAIGDHQAAFSVGVLVDRLSLVVVTFVAALGWVVHGYADRYLLGDARRLRFLNAVAWVVAAALIQAVSPGLVQFGLAWVLMSIAIHRMILHEPASAGAVHAAHAKFWVSRIGDVALLGAVVALIAGPGSTDFSHVFAPQHATALLIACCCLLVTVISKMALVPFQQWLIGTIEAPTPLSALMHAGAINAAGFLLARTCGWFSAVPPAGDLLLLIGLTSAAIGPLVMWCQSDLKRSLAWSTVGQMGFTVVTFALGAPAAAVLHLLGHGCYKANAFLRSGTLTLGVEQRPAPTPILLALSSWVGGTLVAGAVLSGIYSLLARNPGTMPGGWPLVVVQALALGQVLASPTAGAPSWMTRLLILVPFAAGYAGLVWLVETLLVITPPTAPAQLVWLAPMVLAALGLFWVVLPSCAHHPRLRRLRVHATNGFYLNSILQRVRA